MVLNCAWGVLLSQANQLLNQAKFNPTEPSMTGRWAAGSADSHGFAAREVVARTLFALIVNEAFRLTQKSADTATESELWA